MSLKQATAVARDVARPPAIASIAANASPSVRRASTFARARRSAAFNAACASTPATPSWTKIGRPTRLIAYDTQMNIERRMKGEASIYKPLRARTIIYAALILAIGGFMSVDARDARRCALERAA